MKRRSLAAAVRSLHTLPLLAAACMTIITSVHGQFQVPQAEVKLLSPRGFEVSIPGKYTLDKFDGWLVGNVIMDCANSIGGHLHIRFSRQTERGVRESRGRHLVGGRDKGAKRTANLSQPGCHVKGEL